MPVTVVNVGMFERNSSGERTTNITKGTTDQGAVSVEYEGQRFTFGPGQSITFSDAGIGIAVAAQDARLRVSDTREGVRAGGGRT